MMPVLFWRKVSRSTPRIFDALGVAALGIAEAAFLDAHRDDAAEGFLVRRRPAECLAQSVDALLVVVGNLAHRRAGARNHCIEVGTFRSRGGLDRVGTLATGRILHGVTISIHPPVRTVNAE